MRSKIILGILILFAVSGVFAQQATISDFSGSVEIKRPGSAVWEAARKGQTITNDTTISTSFRSTALVTAGSSVITVRPLTRLTLSELVASAGSETINVNLQAGRVRVDVTPPAGTRTNMNVQGPTATASVRGTSFELDIYSLVVTEGTVEFTGASGPMILIDAGRSAFTDESTGRAALPSETAAAELKPDVPVGVGQAAPINTGGDSAGEGIALTVYIRF